MFYCVKFRKCSSEEFVTCWKNLYAYGGEDIYESNLAKVWSKDFKEAVKELYIWKAGIRKIPKKQLIGIKEKIVWLSEFIESPKEKSEIIKEAKRKYLNPEINGAIWNIFFLHCLDPKNIPMFDQHTYRAMIFITKGEIQEIKNYNPTMLKNYNEYKKFLNSHFAGWNQRDVDKALFAFGQFLFNFELDFQNKNNFDSYMCMD